MRYPRQLAALLLILPLLLAVSAHALDDQGEKTLSPYFFIKSEDSSVDRLPLKSTSVHTSIAGVIADVVVTQVYANEGEKPLEAIYVFPASTRAAVHGMKMIIGERIITATIQEREEARRQYEQARQDGKSASLLEQHRPNVFQMSVANILPGDEVRVELRYTELLVPWEGIYEFVYPTVVGPRYADQGVTENPQDRWIANPYLHQGEPPQATFHMTADVSTGVPVQDVTCTSHKINVTYESPRLVSIRLDSSERHGGNRDFILRYRLSGGRIETGMLLYEGEKENFFLLMVQPPKRVTVQEIPPREYIFIVDVSGSMNGFPLDISKKLLQDLIGHLRPVDRFNVLLFAGGSSLLSEQSIPATPENIRQAVAVIERQRGGGGTELLPALKRALSPFLTWRGFLAVWSSPPTDMSVWRPKHSISYAAGWARPICLPLVSTPMSTATSLRAWQGWGWGSRLSSPTRKRPRPRQRSSGNSSNPLCLRTSASITKSSRSMT